MRIRLSLIAAAATAVVLVAACSDQSAATAPVSRSTASTVGNARDDRALSTNAFAAANAKPTDQVGFTKVFTVKSAVVHINSGSSAPATATAVCPAGSFPISGGYGVYLNVGNFHVMYNLPSINNGWSVTAEVGDPFAGTTFDVTVTCIQ